MGTKTIRMFRGQTAGQRREVCTREEGDTGFPGRKVPGDGGKCRRRAFRYRKHLRTTEELWVKDGKTMSLRGVGLAADWK